MSQRALSKVMSQQYISSQWYIPNNVKFKKKTELETNCNLWPVPAFGWAPVIKKVIKNFIFAQQYGDHLPRNISRAHKILSMLADQGSPVGQQVGSSGKCLLIFYLW